MKNKINAIIVTSQRGNLNHSDECSSIFIKLIIITHSLKYYLRITKYNKSIGMMSRRLLNPSNVLKASNPIKCPDTLYSRIFK